MSDSEEIEKKVVEPKVKKPKTEKQVEAWNKALEARSANRKKRAEEKEKLYQEKLAKQQEKLAKKEKIIEKKVRKEITDKLLETDTEDDVEEEPLPKIVKKRKPKVVYVDSDDEEVDNKAPIVIINKFDKKEEKKVAKVIDPLKPQIRFL
jgi:hypothetical protein